MGNRSLWAAALVRHAELLTRVGQETPSTRVRVGICPAIVYLKLITNALLE